MTRSRVALLLLMMVYVLSLLAVGQADDQRKRRVTGKSPTKAATPVGEASSAIVSPNDSFTYYGPDDEAIAENLGEEFPYASSDLAETPDYLLKPTEYSAATADEFVEALQSPPTDNYDYDYEAEYLRDPQANENVAPLPPAEIAATREPAPTEVLEAELENAIANQVETPANSSEMPMSVDSVLFDTLGQAVDSDELFYARQNELAPSPETPVDTCPHFHGCANGISCPLIDRCREQMRHWRREQPTTEFITTEPLAVTKPVAPSETQAREDIEDDGMYTGEFGPAYELDDYGCPVAPKKGLYHPDVYGLDCDHYLDDVTVARPSVAAKSLDDGRWECDDYPCYEFHGAPSSVARRDQTTSANEFADDESMWDCHLADPSYVPVAKPAPTLAAKPAPKAKNEPTLAPPRPAKKVAATSMFLDQNGDLAKLWTVSLADLLADPSHSEGLDLAWYINVENDGLTRAPRVDRHTATLGVLSQVWNTIAPAARFVGRQIDQARGQWYADYGYPWDEEAFPARGFHHDLNLELEF
jgi:hypothetical protein